MRKLLLILGLTLSSSLTGFAGTAPEERFVILLSIDGLRVDALSLEPREIPYFRQLLKEGSGTLQARSDPSATVTLPNHVSMLTGMPVEGPLGHRYTENAGAEDTIHRIAGRYVPSVFDAARSQGLKTGFFASKKKFEVFLRSYGRGGPNGDKLSVAFVSDRDDDATWEAFKKAMTEDPPQLTFLHFSGPDNVGHAHSWSLEPNSRYRLEIGRQDRYLGRLLETIRSSPRLNGRTTLILTSDHGGVTGERTHIRPDEPLNFTVPFVTWGASVKPDGDLYQLNRKWRQKPGRLDKKARDGKEPIRNADAANTALAVLGLDPLPHGAGSGRPLQLKDHSS